MSEELKLFFSFEISKYNLIINVSNEMIDHEDYTSDHILALIEIEEENEC